MRNRFNYANVTATLALFFAMSGGALAAKHYLINKTSQISPSVLKALKGKEGPRGLAGTPGAPGAAGAAGKEGAEGKAGARGETGPSHAYSKETTGEAETLTASVGVPAGIYAMTGNGYAANNEEVEGSMKCELKAAGAEVTSRSATIPHLGEIISAKTRGQNSIETQGTATLSSSGEIVESCAKPITSPANIKITKVSVLAILVGGVN